MVNTSSKRIEEALGNPVLNKTGKINWDNVIKFSTRAPVLQPSDEGLELVERIFPVSPFPNSRLSGFANQSDGKEDESADPEDRQIRRIYDVPRWKKTFNAEPLLVPMTQFTEYAYWGEQAGSALGFRIPKQELFFAAALSIKPFVPKVAGAEGFSILTHTATEEMLQYHQRLIVLLPAKSALGYFEEMSAEDRFQYLIRHRYAGHLLVDKIRNMAKGWEKRVSVQKAKLHREESYRNTLKVEQVEG